MRRRLSRCKEVWKALDRAINEFIQGLVLELDSSWFSGTNDIVASLFVLSPLNLIVIFEKLTSTPMCPTPLPRVFSVARSLRRQP